MSYSWILFLIQTGFSRLHSQVFTCFPFLRGIFLWDTWESLITWEVSGIGFITHGVLCSFIYLISLYPFGHYWALAFLMFETSTPFINVHWLMTNVEPLKKWKITLSVNDILGGIAFFLFSNCLWNVYVVSILDAIPCHITYLISISFNLSLFYLGNKYCTQ